MISFTKQFYPEIEGEDHVCEILCRVEKTLLVRIFRVVTIDRCILSLLRAVHNQEMWNCLR